MQQTLKYTTTTIPSPKKKGVVGILVNEEEKELLDLISVIVFEKLINKSK